MTSKFCTLLYVSLIIHGISNASNTNSINNQPVIQQNQNNQAMNRKIVYETLPWTPPKNCVAFSKLFSVMIKTSLPGLNANITLNFHPNYRSCTISGVPFRETNIMTKSINAYMHYKMCQLLADTLAPAGNTTNYDISFEHLFTQPLQHIISIKPQNANNPCLPLTYTKPLKEDELFKETNTNVPIYFPFVSYDKKIYDELFKLFHDDNGTEYTLRITYRPNVITVKQLKLPSSGCPLFKNFFERLTIIYGSVILAKLIPQLKNPSGTSYGHLKIIKKHRENQQNQPLTFKITRTNELLKLNTTNEEKINKEYDEYLKELSKNN